MRRSLNRGEVARAKNAPAGQQVGWDVVGVVERGADRAERSAVGTTVVGLVGNGAWAELAAVPVDYLAAVPGGVTPAQAACVPVAGMTAFRALALGGFPVGKRVLVTGASGGVGHVAVQLARAAQMTVTGLIRTPEAQSTSPSPHVTTSCVTFMKRRVRTTISSRVSAVRCSLGASTS